MNGKCLPMIYSLLPNKETKSYDKLFKFLANKIPQNKHPKFFSHDFEKAATNSIENHFFKSKFEGCFFHFSQCLWRRIQKTNLVTSYKSKSSTGKETRRFYRHLLYLAFVPVKDVVYTFNKIKSISPSNFKPMITYFEKNFIGSATSIPKLRKKPRFEIKSWNVRDRVLEGVGRTNNNIEAWHNAFQNDCKKHTNLSKFIKTVKLEQSNTESLIAKIESGIIIKKDKKEEERDNILMNHILNFKKEDSFSWLDIIIKIFKD